MHHDPAEDRRLYVIVRADLPVGYQMAQACHAAAAIGADQPENLRRYPTIVILDVTDEQMLKAVLHGTNASAVPFFEPDLGGEMTAFAVFSAGREFGDLTLAGGGIKPEAAMAP